MSASHTSGGGETTPNSADFPPPVTFRTLVHSPATELRETEVEKKLVQEQAEAENQTIKNKIWENYWKYWATQQTEAGRSLKLNAKKNTISDSSSGKSKDFTQFTVELTTNLHPDTNIVSFVVSTPHSAVGKGKEEIEARRSHKIQLQMEGLQVYTQLELQEKIGALREKNPDLSEDAARQSVIDAEMKRSPNIFEFKIPYVARGRDAAQMLLFAEKQDPKLIPKLSEQAKNKLISLKQHAANWKELTEEERNAVENYLNPKPAPKPGEETPPPQLGGHRKP